MPNYRFYTGHQQIDPLVIDFASDQEAIDKANRLLSGLDIEVWQGARVVIQLRGASAMGETKSERANAARCLRQAKSAQDKEEKQSWLALAESWLTTAQLQSTRKGDSRVTEDKKVKALEWAAQ